MKAAAWRSALLAATFAAALLAGCATAPPAPESMRDPQADFAAYRTFGWLKDSDGSADAPLRILDGNIRAAIVAELARRGYVEASPGTTPDLRIGWQTASAERIENNPVRVGIGVGSWGGSFGGSVSMGSPSVRSYQEGTLVIHAVDARRNAEVWQGRVSRKITKGSVEPAMVSQAVAAAMQDFPGRVDSGS
jgi:hypothetical protein